MWLLPLQRAHLSALFLAIGHPVIFAGGYGGGASVYRDTEEAFTGWAVTYFCWDDCNPSAVFLVGGPRDGELPATTVTDPCSSAPTLPHRVPCQDRTTGTLRICPSLLIPPLSS